MRSPSGLTKVSCDLPSKRLTNVVQCEHGLPADHASVGVWLALGELSGFGRHEVLRVLRARERRNCATMSRVRHGGIQEFQHHLRIRRERRAETSVRPPRTARDAERPRYTCPLSNTVGGRLDCEPARSRRYPCLRSRPILDAIDRIREHLWLCPSSSFSPKL